MGDKIMAVLGTLGIAVVITSLTLPNRNTPSLVKAVGTAGSQLFKAAAGQ